MWSAKSFARPTKPIAKSASAARRRVIILNSRHSSSRTASIRSRSTPIVSSRPRKSWQKRRVNENDADTLVCVTAMTSERTLQSVIDSLGERGDKTALVDFDKKDRHRWSFQKLAASARAFANGLVRQDFKRGDTIALFAGNSPEWIASALGIIRAGMVAVPLDVQLDEKTLVHVLQDSDVRAIIMTQKGVERIEKLNLKEKPRLILLDAGEENSAEADWKRFLESVEKELPTVSCDDEAVLFYTSGTTGPPKGVPLSHGNVVSQLDTAADVHLITGGDRVLLPLPLHHVYPFVIVMLAPLALILPLILH